MQSFRRKCQFGGMGFAGQAYRREHLATVRFDIALQVRQRTTHANKVINQYIFGTSLYDTGELCWARHARKTISACVKHHIDLSHACVMRPRDGFADFNRKCVRNGIDTFAFVGMGTDQRRCASSQQIDQLLISLLAHGVVHQRSSRQHMTRFGRLVSRMLFHRRLTGMNQHVGKVSPRGARRWQQV